MHDSTPFWLLFGAAVALLALASRHQQQHAGGVDDGAPAHVDLRDAAWCATASMRALRSAAALQERRHEQWLNDTAASACVRERAARLDVARRRVPGDWWAVTRAAGEREGWWRCADEGPACEAYMATAWYVAPSAAPPVERLYGPAPRAVYAPHEMTVTLSCAAAAAECEWLEARCAAASPTALLAIAGAHAAAAGWRALAAVGLVAAPRPFEGDVEEGWRQLRERTAAADADDDADQSFAGAVGAWFARARSAQCVVSPWRAYSTRIVHSGYRQKTAAASPPTESGRDPKPEL